VVATFSEFNHGRAVMAALPAFSLGDLHEPLRFFILRTLFLDVPFAVAGAADFCLATAAFAKLPAGRAVGGDISGLDPLAATSGGAINAVLGGILLILAIPLHFELEIEELFDVLERDVVGGAALGGHMLRVGDGEFEDAAQTVVAHVMAAG
jgi:hypothetical protein